MTSMQHRPTRTALGRLLAAAALLGPDAARASFLSGEALDTAANVLSWVVLVIVPIVGIVVFWLIHILPEKIAEQRRHPQAKAIQTLCLLSLLFGGLLWPLAWLWAYSKPVFYKLAYGTDVADAEHGGAPAPDDAGESARTESAHPLHDEIESLRRQLGALEARVRPEARG